MIKPALTPEEWAEGRYGEVAATSKAMSRLLRWIRRLFEPRRRYAVYCDGKATVVFENCTVVESVEEGYVLGEIVSRDKP